MFAITEVRILLAEALHGRRNGKLLAFASIVLDDAFAVQDLKVINGHAGLFVCMPSRRLADHCPGCRSKVVRLTNFCAECGVRLGPWDIPRDEGGKLKLHVDVAHPIHQDCRVVIDRAVLDAYHAEMARFAAAGDQTAA